MNSQKGIASTLAIIIVIAIGVIAIGGVLAYQYLWAPEEKMEVEEETPKDETADWKTYRNEEYGFEFKHPDWSLSQINTGSGHDPSKPFLLIWAGITSDEPCYDIGCFPMLGDREELTKGVASQGELGIHPWFKVLIVKDTEWVSIQLTDATINRCSSIDFCEEYIAKVDLKNKINNADYKVYNDFLNLLSTFKFID